MLYNNLEDVSSAPNPRFYLRVGRPGLIINGARTSLYERYRMRWETNLTILHGKMWAGTQALRLTTEPVFVGATWAGWAGRVQRAAQFGCWGCYRNARQRRRCRNVKTHVAASVPIIAPAVTSLM